jgi:hypothetical protein
MKKVENPSELEGEMEHHFNCGGCFVSVSPQLRNSARHPLSPYPWDIIASIGFRPIIRSLKVRAHEEG